MPAKSTQIAVRLESDLIELADRIAEQLARVTIAGLEPTRTAVIRAAIARGLRSMQEELACKTKATAPKSRKG